MSKITACAQCLLYIDGFCRAERPLYIANKINPETEVYPGCIQKHDESDKIFQIQKMLGEKLDEILRKQDIFHHDERMYNRLQFQEDLISEIMAEVIRIKGAK